MLNIDCFYHLGGENVKYTNAIPNIITFTDRLPGVNFGYWCKPLSIGLAPLKRLKEPSCHHMRNIENSFGPKARREPSLELGQESVSSFWTPILQNHVKPVVLTALTFYLCSQHQNLILQGKSASLTVLVGKLSGCM